MSYNATLQRKDGTSIELPATYQGELPDKGDQFEIELGDQIIPARVEYVVCVAPGPSTYSDKILNFVLLREI